MVATAHAKDDSALGQNIGHGEVFGQAKRVPHGYNVESAPKSQLIGLGGQVKAEHKQVRDSFIALRLKMVLRQPQRIVIQWFHQARQGQGFIEHRGQVLVRLDPVVDAFAVEAHISHLNMAAEEIVKIFDHRFPPRYKLLVSVRSTTHLWWFTLVQSFSTSGFTRRDGVSTNT